MRDTECSLFRLHVCRGPCTLLRSTMTLCKLSCQSAMFWEWQAPRRALPNRTPSTLLVLYESCPSFCSGFPSARCSSEVTINNHKPHKPHKLLRPTHTYTLEVVWVASNPSRLHGHLRTFASLRGRPRAKLNSLKV